MHRFVLSAAQLSILTGTLLLISSSSRAQITETSPNPKIVVIHVSQPVADAPIVPATLFGSFLEPIGNSINQGLAAELLMNGSLEDGMWSYANIQKMVVDEPAIATSNNETGLPYPWEPLHPQAGRRYELHHGNAANSWQSVEIMGFPGPAVGIMQRVYLPVQRTLAYDVSFYARHVEGDPDIQLSILKHGRNDILAEAKVSATAGGWSKYTAVLTLKANSVQPMEPVDFAISVAPDERIDVDEFSLQPSDAVDGLDPDVLSLATAMGSTIVRFGGNFSSAYHWREGIGPLDKRIAEQNIAWGIPEYNKFGTDEFLEFCKRLHAVPQIDLNMGSGTPEEAADWVRYIGQHYDGKIIYELGNELYGSWQVGHVTAEQIAAKTIAFSSAVRAVDPTAEIIATGGMPQQFVKWNEAQLTTPAGTFDLLSTHFIRATNQVSLEPATPDFIASAAYALPVELGRDFRKMQDQLDAVPALRDKVHFAMDEWLFNSRGVGDRVFTNESPSSKNEGGGLMVASVFNTLVRDSRIVPVSEMTGLMEFAGIWKDREQVYATPAYYIFRLYTTIQGNRILPVTTNSGAYDVHGGVEGFTQMTDIPYIDAIATYSEDGRHMTLFCINRALKQDIPVQFELGDFKVTSAHVEQMTSTSRFDGNDATHPMNVVPKAVTIKIPQSGRITASLPHESVTMVRFDTKP